MYEKDVGFYGGSVALADYCPYIQEFTWRSNNVVVRGSHCMYEENNPSEYLKIDFKLNGFQKPVEAMGEHFWMGEPDHQHQRTLQATHFIGRSKEQRILIATFQCGLEGCQQPRQNIFSLCAFLGLCLPFQHAHCA